MAMNTNATRQTNWWVWGDAAAAAIVLIAALSYEFSWFGSDTADAVAAAIEETAPITE